MFIVPTCILETSSLREERHVPLLTELGLFRFRSSINVFLCVTLRFSLRALRLLLLVLPQSTQSETRRAAKGNRTTTFWHSVVTVLWEPHAPGEGSIPPLKSNPISSSQINDDVVNRL